MSLEFGFYDSIERDRTYNAMAMCRIFDGIITDGVFAGAYDKFALTVEHTANGNYVNVGTGMAWFDHTWTYNNAPIPLEVPQNASGSMVTHYIELIVDRRTGSRLYGRQNRITISYNGPYIPESEDVHVHHLGIVRVPSGAAAINQNWVVPYIGTNDCPYVTAAASIGIDHFVRYLQDAIESYLNNTVRPETDLWFEGLIEEYLEDHPALVNVSLSDLGCGRADCAVSSASAAKSITIEGYKLIDGGKIAVYFEHAIAPTSATLNVSNGETYLGAKPVYYQRSSELTSGIVNDGDTALIMYNASLNNGTGGYEIIAISRATSGGSSRPAEGWAETDLDASVQAKLNRIQNGYASCSTGSSTATKQVTIDGYSEVAGSVVSIAFVNKVNSGASLAIRSSTSDSYPTGKAIRYNGATINTGVIPAGAVATFVYDGTYYNLIGIDLNGNGIGACTDSGTTRSVSIPKFAGVAGSIIAVRFTNSVPAGCTLNVSLFGAKDIYHKNAAIAANVIKAGDTATFMYDGTRFHLLGTDAPSSSGSGVDNIDNIVYITAVDNGQALVASVTAADIAYQIISLGKNILYCFVDPSDNAIAPMYTKPSGAYAADVSSVAFSRPDYANSQWIYYTIDTSGGVIMSYIPFSTSSGGTTTLPELGGGYATSSNGASTVARTASISGYVLTVGNGPTIKFTTSVDAANSTLNVSNGSSNTGAKAIWYRGAAVPSGFITAGSLVKFVYDGTHYCVESIDKEFYVKEAAGIPQTDLAKETVTFTAGSGTPVTYSSSKTFAEINTANAAGKLIVPVFNGFEGRYIDVGQNAATFEVIDATNPSAPAQYIFVVSGTGCAGAASNWGGSGYTGPTITTPTQEQNGYVLKANADGSTSWVSISSLLTAWTPNNPYGGGN